MVEGTFNTGVFRIYPGQVRVGKNDAPNGGKGLVPRLRLEYVSQNENPNVIIQVGLQEQVRFRGQRFAIAFREVPLTPTLASITTGLNGPGLPAAFPQPMVQVQTVGPSGGSSLVVHKRPPSSSSETS